ncbi:MAG TPA: 50S ribosomal protein L1 [Candidatus Krumholzibacteria bacterium]|nr:50S ribosomal protein L1 [Candidatus Krumholzibacteria bacterium]
MKRGKSWKAAQESIDRLKLYDLDEAVETIQALPKAKFDESVDLSVKLGVDPRHADQMVRGTVVLPNGTGKTVRVLVLTQGPKVDEAKEAGADHVGSDEYIEKLQGGWLDVDVIIATPDMMGKVGRLGKILGPRGLMPNPKVGTVTMDVAKAVSDSKAGRVEYRVDKAGNIHCPVGRRSFDSQALTENIQAVLKELQRAKPAAAKGNYMQSCSISATMSPAVRVDTSKALKV